MYVLFCTPFKAPMLIHGHFDLLNKIYYYDFERYDSQLPVVLGVDKEKFHQIRRGNFE